MQSPVAQAGLAPHRQSPAEEQVSAFEPHATHAAPLGPQVAVERLAQVPLAVQHPAAHEVASQTQAPPRQRSPDAHGTLAPQRHEPAVQTLAVTPHETQAPPLVLQELSAIAVQFPAAEQHPVGHEVPSQTQRPFTQR